MDYKKTYPVSWVVMQNTIQECFKSMSIDEKRLLILASPIARTIDATEKDAITITSESFAKECGIKTNSAYSQMEEASKNLLRRYFPMVIIRKKSTVTGSLEQYMRMVQYPYASQRKFF